MTSESNRISAASVAYVDGVCRAWGWAWSEMGQADDDGFDGLIYSRTKQINIEKPADRRYWKHVYSGGLIHSQIKSGASYIVDRTPEYIEIRVADIFAKKDLWLKSPIPVALIYVQEEVIGKTPRNAWWTDLKSSESYTTRGSILIPLKNRFQAGIECRSLFNRLAKGQQRYLGLTKIDMTEPSALPNKLDQMSKAKKAAAIEFYKKWKASCPINPKLGQIIVNRTGWSHLTRSERPVPRILNSFELLPAAARIVSEIKDWKILRRGKSIRELNKHNYCSYDYIGISALVNWQAKPPTEVMVILRRQTTISEGTDIKERTTKVFDVSVKIWFYSVYEPGRRRLV